VDFLDTKRLIDQKRVGLIGFSRTGVYVKTALVDPRYHFKAASVYSDSDAGYLQWVSGTNFYPNYNYIEGLNGGIPYGTGMTKWAERSPSFNLQKVDTPLRIVADNQWAVLWEWEWFAGLTRLEKPVDFVVLKDAAHVVEKPWDKMVLQQGNVDWFCFWLKSEEDPDPAKAEQYTRWRELRKAQERRSTRLDTETKH
jgi:dipeptidyl aminopeptidase/acylaminoacyl peptidase